MKLFHLTIAGLGAILAGCTHQANDAAEPVPEAQQAAAPPPQAASGPAFERVGRDTPRHDASGAAATRALAVCSGLWSAGQSMQVIDATYPAPEPLEAFPAEIDEQRKIVSVGYDDVMPPRIAAWRPVLGCLQLPAGATADALDGYLLFSDGSLTPNFDNETWPMGDQDAVASLSSEVEARLGALVEQAFDGETYKGNSWAVLVVKNGKIVAEQYSDGYGMHIGGQTHSAAKSFAASVVGLGVRSYDVDVYAGKVLEQWSRPGDPRGEITVDHLIRMSSGLYTEGNGSPLMDVYRQGGTVAGRAASNILDQPPGTRFLYSPPDTQLMLRAIHEAVGDDQTYLELPFRELFWKIGMTRTVPATDWAGDYLMSGQTYSTARDFARFGLLYLNDGVWNGERILPDGWTDYVSKPGAAQPERGGNGYGGHFWLYGGQDGLQLV